MSDLKQFSILYVDDETMALKYFEKEFKSTFRILTAPSAADGWDLVEKHHQEIGVIMSDQRMPGQSGVALLERVRHTYPQIIRILVTAFSDVDSAVAGVNAGAIYKYIGKPWDVNDLRITLMRALEYFSVLRERDQLLREKLSVLQQIVLSDRTKNLGVLAAGLSCSYRNTLKAASEFASAIPQAEAKLGAADTLRSAIGRNIESSVNSASRQIFEIAQGLRGAGSQGGGAEPFSLVELVRDAARASSDRVAVEVTGEVPAHRGNPQRVRQSIEILLKALCAVSPGRLRIRIEAKASEPGHGAGSIVTFSDDAGDWGLEQAQRFFSPFLAPMAGELGIQLAVCFFLVYDQGGSLAVRIRGETKVRLELPADSSAGDDTLRPELLQELFHHERRWEDFLSPAG